jgi:hypothetical protein
MSPAVEVLVDLRRYLPDGRFTWANFQAISRIEYRPDTAPREFGEQLEKNLASCLPLVEMVGYVAKSRLLSLVVPSRRDNDWIVGERSTTGAATVALSDVTRLPPVADVRWRRGAQPTLAIAGQPASRSHITILICAPTPGEVQVTATYYPTEFDGDKIKHALTQALAIADPDHPPGGLPGQN